MARVYALRYGISDVNSNIFLHEYSDIDYANIVAKAYSCWRDVKYECIVTDEKLPYSSTVSQDKIEGIVAWYQEVDML